MGQPNLAWSVPDITFFDPLTNPHILLPRLNLLLKGAGERGAKKIRVHVLTDGRDVLDSSSFSHAETLEKDLSELCGYW